MSTVVILRCDGVTGTIRGYSRHIAVKEKPCDSCRAARNARKRARAAVTLVPGRPSIDERFWSKVTGGGVETCWEWVAYRDQNGYGRFGVGGRSGGMDMAHRVSWRLLRGDIPAGLQLDHLCFNRACVNPWHLDPCTNEVNSRRSTAAQVNAARQLAITSCPQGHAYDEQNTRVKRNGSRACRACARAYAAKRRAAA